MILSVDSSSVTAAAALCDDDCNILNSEFSHSGLTHSETLLPMIKRVMGDRSFDQLSAVAVTVGPGSFTGVRIGVATVKGLAFASDIPCVPVSSLEAVAYNFIEENAVVCVVMDARRQQYYNALFEIKDGKVIRLTPDRALGHNELVDELEKFDNVIAAGDGANLLHERWGKCILCSEDKQYVTGRGVALAAKDKEKISAALLMPVYLRLSQAERELKLKRR